MPISAEMYLLKTRNKSALIPPTIHPITGKYLGDFWRYSGLWSIFFGTPIRVRNIRAVKNIRISFFMFTFFWLYLLTQKKTFPQENSQRIELAVWPNLHLFLPRDAFRGLAKALPRGGPTFFHG